MADGPTVEQAIRILGANKSFMAADVGFAHACVALIRVGQKLNDQQRQRAHRMLERYSDELASYGIPYAAIVAPNGRSVAPILAPPPSTRPTAVGRSRLYVAKNGRLAAKVPYVLKDRLSEVLGGRWDKQACVWHWPASPATAEALLEALSPSGVDYDDDVTKLLAEAHRIKEVSVHKAASDLPPVPGSKTEAWLHQRQAFWFARGLTAVMLDMEMGPVAGSAMVTINRGGNARQMPLATACSKMDGAVPGGNRYRGLWNSDIPSYVRGLRADGRLGLVPLLGYIDKGEQPVIRLTMDDGHSVVCTPDHEIATPDRWKVRAGDLLTGDLVFTDSISDRAPKREPRPRQRPGPKLGPKRGESIDGSGYRWLYLPDHPNATSGGQVLEHVAVMVKSLERPIVNPECVHHLDGDPLNNDLGNLVLCADQQEHAKYHDWRLNLPGVTPRRSRIIAIDDAGTEDVYCLSVGDDAHTFVADGVKKK